MVKNEQMMMLESFATNKPMPLRSKWATKERSDCLLFSDLTAHLVCGTSRASASDRRNCKSV